MESRLTRSSLMCTKPPWILKYLGFLVLLFSVLGVLTVAVCRILQPLLGI